MEDRDGKKPFTIPKTHSLTKDVLLSEKTDSRNVTELFDDIKPCLLDAKFDFRKNECKSCDTIRNQKLQKIYNEKRINMKKEHEPSERFVFHLISSRDIALTIATEGLACEQLSLPINKYLGNPKDGIHLCRRPDVLLASTGTQGLYKFGLLICKVLLGKGYPTLPSTTNDQLAAQLHYDHHFCRVQSATKEQRSLDDLLANSMVFCYEHEDFQTLSRPSQILPIAVLWYEVNEKFSSELPSSTKLINHESQQRNGKLVNGGIAKKKFTGVTKKSIPSLLSLPLPPVLPNDGVWDAFSKDITTTVETSTSNSVNNLKVKYPGHVMVPFNRQQSLPTQLPSAHTVQPFNTNQTSTIQSSSRDPRLLRNKRETTVGSESTPISPSHNQTISTDRSTSDLFAIKQANERTPDGKTKSNNHQEQSTRTTALHSVSSVLSCDETTPTIKLSSNSSVRIPLESIFPLKDPRSQSEKSDTRTLCHLEASAVRHALQKQKRLNHYHDPKSGSLPKTTYTLVPFIFRQVSQEEYDAKHHHSINNGNLFRYPSVIDSCPPLCISVVDLSHFGFVDNNQMSTFIDLNENENEIALKRLQISNETIEQEKQSSSEQVRIRMREKRRRKLEQRMKEKKKLDLPPPLLPSESAILNIARENEVFSPPPLIIAPPISMSNSKLYISTGRQILREHRLPIISPNAVRLTPDFLDFLCREYHNEERPHVKKLLAELAGVFIEKYGIGQRQTTDTNKDHVRNHRSEDVPDVESQTMSVIDMDIATPPSDSMGDFDERFRIPTPPPPLPPSPPPPPLPSSLPPELFEKLSSGSLLLTQTLPNQPNKVFDDPTYNDRCREIVEKLKEQQKKTELTSPLLLPPPSTSSLKPIVCPDDAAFKACLGQIECSSSESSCTGDSRQASVNGDLQQPIVLPVTQESSEDIEKDSTRSLIELLTKKTSMSTSSNSPVDNYHKRSYNQHHHRRRSYDEDDEEDENENSLSKFSSQSKFQRRNSYRSPPKYSSRNDKNRSPRSIRHSTKTTVSSSRTVTVVSNRITVTNEIDNQLSLIADSNNVEQQTPIEEQNDEQHEPTVKRIKVDLIPSITNPTDWIPESSVSNETILGDSGSATVSVVTDEHDYRLDLDERRRAAAAVAASSLPTTEDNPIVKSPHSRSRSKSKDNNNEHDHRRLSTGSRNSSLKNTSKPARQRRRSSESSSDRGSPNGERYRRPLSYRKRPSFDDNDQRQHLSTNRNFRSHTASSKQRFNSLSVRHAMGPFKKSSYRGSKPSTYHQRNGNDLNTNHHRNSHQPRHQRFNYNHQSIADHPRFATTTGAITSPTNVTDYNSTNNYSFQTSPSDRNSSNRSTSPSTRTRNTLPMTIEDLNSASPMYYDESLSTYHHENVLSTDNYEHLQEHRSIVSESTYQNSSSSKPSETFEQLELLIQNHPNRHFDHTQRSIDQSMNSITSFPSSSTISSSFSTIPSTNSSNLHWPTSRFVSTQHPNL